MNGPLSFVLMPFGEKPDGMGGTVNVDAVYRELIAPLLKGIFGLAPKALDEPLVVGVVLPQDL